jgi:hypothetical protein
MTSIHIFNITNMDDLLHRQTKPVVQDLGPFVFEEFRQKVNYSFSQDRNKLRYFQKRTWMFRPDLTPGGESSLDQIVNHINVPLLSAGQFALKMNEPFFFYAVNRFQEEANSSLYMKHSVRELLFEGYSDPLIEASGGLFPDMPFDKFGWFYKKNESYIRDGEFEMDTGKDDVSKLGYLIKWRNMSSLSNFDPKSQCASFEAVSAGDFQPPSLFSSEDRNSIKIFVPEICRSFKLEIDRNKNQSRVFSLNTRRFSGGSVFDYNIDENKCYCNDGCLPNGIANISSCVFDSPTVISFPHFTRADKSLLDDIDGLHPNEEKYPLFMDLFDEIGLPAKVDISLQINVFLTKDDRLNYSRNSFKNVAYYPCLYFTSTAQVDQDMANQLALLQMIHPGLSTYSSILFFVIGMCLLSFSFLSHRRYKLSSQANDRTRLLNR